jgi:hypothetical protein
VDETSDFRPLKNHRFSSATRPQFDCPKFLIEIQTFENIALSARVLRIEMGFLYNRENFRRDRQPRRKFSSVVKNRAFSSPDQPSIYNSQNSIEIQNYQSFKFGAVSGFRLDHFSSDQSFRRGCQPGRKFSSFAKKSVIFIPQSIISSTG